MKTLIALTILAIILGLSVATPVVAQPLVDGEDPRDPDLVYLQIRGDLDETDVVGHGVPDTVNIGIFKGYSLPIQLQAGNEELYFSICVPDRYDEEHDIVIETVIALSLANEGGKHYQIDIAWEKVTPNDEVVPVAFHSVSAQRLNLSNLQYYCYRDYFVVDYDAPVDDPIVYDDEIAFRLRHGSTGLGKDITGELIVLHFGVLFPRGDLLGNPGDVITEEDMEEVGIQLGNFVVVLEGWTAYFLIWFGLLFILGLSYLAFWRWNPVLFMLTAGASIVFGFYWYDAFTTNLGLALGLMMMAYALVCVGFAFRCIFWRNKEINED